FASLNSPAGAPHACGPGLGSAVVLVAVVALGHAKVVVAAKVDVVVGRILVVVDVLEIVVGEIGIGFLLDFLLLFFLEGNRLLGLEHRLGRPLVPAFDAGHRIVLAEVVKAFTALGAIALGAPLWLDHCKSSMLPAQGTGLKSRET